MPGAIRIRQWFEAVRSRPFAMDVALAATPCAITVMTSVVSTHHGGTVSGAAIVAAVIAYGAVLCRRRWPVAALALTVAAATVFLMLSYGNGWVVVAPLIALYHLAVVTSDRRRVLFAGGLAVLILAVIPELAAHTSGLRGPWLNGAQLAVAAACGLALAAGDATRSRHAYVAEVEERAYRAAQSREQEAHRRVTEERMRIARDLHDSMGHHIALINAQAGMATHVFHEQPGTARQALTHIRQASRSALDELREILGLLRQPGEPAAATAPTVGVLGLGDLVSSFRGSGMRIDHEVEGSVLPLPPAADLTAYRVVQESLTNARKHAAGASTMVRLLFHPGALHIVVENEGNGRSAHRTSATSVVGHGIVGMRERVSAIGGSLDAGPRPDGGFRVSAVLPLPEGDRP